MSYMYNRFAMRIRFSCSFFSLFYFTFDSIHIIYRRYSSVFCSTFSVIYESSAPESPNQCFFTYFHPLFRPSIYYNEKLAYKNNFLSCIVQSRGKTSDISLLTMIRGDSSYTALRAKLVSTTYLARAWTACVRGCGVNVFSSRLKISYYISPVTWLRKLRTLNISSCRNWVKTSEMSSWCVCVRARVCASDGLLGNDFRSDT